MPRLPSYPFIGLLSFRSARPHSPSKRLFFNASPRSVVHDGLKPPRLTLSRRLEQPARARNTPSPDTGFSI